MNLSRRFCSKVTLVLVFILTLVTAENSFASDKKLRLKMSTPGADSSPSAIGAKKWSEIVSKKSNGRIKIQVYPNEQLSSGNQAKGLENLRIGVTEASITSTIIYTVLDPRFGVVTLPWLMPNNDAVDKAFKGRGGDKLKEIVRSKGIEPINFMENGFRQLTNNVRPIRTPQDLKNLKIRIPSNKLYIDVFKALGADPTIMNMGETFTSLQQGVIDGQENPITVIFSNKLYEVQKYLTIMNYSYDTFILGVNKKFWDSLDDEDKNILSSAAEEACLFKKKYARALDIEEIKKMEKSGVMINELTQSEIAAFKEKVQPVFDQYSKQYGKELVDAFLNP